MIGPIPMRNATCNPVATRAGGGDQRSTRVLRAPTCFTETDPKLSLARRTMVEGIGTLILLFVATATGLATSQRISGDPGVGSIASAAAIPGTVVALVLAFGAVSGGHFNPLITALQWLGGERSRICAAAYVAAQFVGAVAGAWLANVVFEATREVQPIVVHALWVPSEIVASAGLLIVVFGCARSGRVETGPFGVGLWLFAAAIALPSTYLNPALTVGSMIAAGPFGRSAQVALPYLPSQIAGALIAFAVICAAYPKGVARHAMRRAAVQ